MLYDEPRTRPFPNIETQSLLQGMANFGYEAVAVPGAETCAQALLSSTTRRTDGLSVRESRLESRDTRVVLVEIGRQKRFSHTYCVEEETDEWKCWKCWKLADGRLLLVGRTTWLQHHGKVYLNFLRLSSPLAPTQDVSRPRCPEYSA